MQPTPTRGMIKTYLSAGRRATEASVEARDKFRRHRPLNRRDELAPIMAAMKSAAKDIRRIRAMYLYHPIDEQDAEDCRVMSDQLTRERRRLQKMIDASPGLPR